MSYEHDPALVAAWAVLALWVVLPSARRRLFERRVRRVESVLPLSTVLGGVFLLFGLVRLVGDAYRAVG